jgi:CRP-like cAMP-binding protein
MGDSAAFRVIGPGRALGDVSVAASNPRRSSTVVALEPTVTLAMSFAEFHHLVANHPQVQERLATLLSARVRRLTEHLVEALYLPSDRRVVNRLIDLCTEYGTPPGSPGSADSPGATPVAPTRVVVPLTQTDLSQLAGAARPTTNRVLRALEQEGLVRLARGRIEVLDVVALSQRRAAV